MDQRLIDSVKQHEGLRLRAYQDTAGVWTIGYGRNLQTLRIDAETAEQWLREDLQAALEDAKRFPEFKYLDTQARRNVFVEMCFNLGATRLALFTKMLAAIRKQDWERVADEMLDSKWARDVKGRARTLAEIMRRGHYA